MIAASRFVPNALSAVRGRYDGPRSCRADLLGWLLVGAFSVLGLWLLWTNVLEPNFFEDDSCLDQAVTGVLNNVGGSSVTNPGTCT